MTIDELRKYYGDNTSSEEQLMERYNREKEKYDAEVSNIVNDYDKLNMDLFIRRIGGYEKIEQMNKINEKLDRSELVNGKLVDKTPISNINENLEEWKKGFMEGFEEAYKRLMGSK